MSARRRVFVAAALIAFAAPVFAQKYGVGRPPTAEEAKKWDLSIGPDGSGLPEGSGTAVEGKQVFERRCQRCHGAGGVGGDEPPLVGGQGTLATPKPLKTVGSFWPYATTLFDYIRRAMPFKQPGTLNDAQVYAVTAYILHLNKIVGENQSMDAKALAAVKMPNREGFTADPRPDTGAGAKRRK
jgi:cytochrome c